MFSRKLRLELKNAQLKIIELSDDVQRKRDEKITVIQRKNTLEKEVHAQGIEIKALKEKMGKLEECVHEQTEADLLLNALKSVGVIPEKEKKDYFHEDNKLRSSLAQQRSSLAQYQKNIQQLSYPNGAHNLMSGLTGAGNAYNPYTKGELK